MTKILPREIAYDASGMRFGALAWDPPSTRRSPPLALCLHGYPDTAWTWRHLGPYLAGRGWRVVAPFMRGYAPTDLSPDGRYGVGDLAADAQNAHIALGGDNRAVLIGHDWGALATYCAGADTPALFHRYVALGYPAPRTILESLSSPVRALGSAQHLLRQGAASWYMAFQQLPFVSERSLDWLIPKLWQLWSPNYDASSDVARALAALSTPERRTAALRYYRALVLPRYQSTAHAHQQARWLEVPSRETLYLHGAEDRCGLPEFARRTEAILAPGSRFELIAGAGHFLHLERSEQVNALIAGFISG